MELEAVQVEVVGGRPRGVQSKAVACRRVLPDFRPVDGYPEKARPGNPSKVARADQDRLAVELVGDDLRILLAHGVLGEGAELSPRQAPLDVVDKAGRLEEEAAVLSFVPLARRGHGDDDDRLAVGVDFSDDPGDVVRRVFVQIAPLPEPWQALLNHPSASAVDLPRKGRLQLPKASVQDVGRRADPVEEGQEDDLPVYRRGRAVGVELARSKGRGPALSVAAVVLAVVAARGPRLVPPRVPLAQVAWTIIVVCPLLVLLPPRR